MNVIKYLQKAGFSTVDRSFYSEIVKWKSWYIGNVRNFHKYRVYTGKRYVTCKRLSLGMAKKLSEDIADLLLNERVQTTIQDTTTHDFVMQVLKDNNFSVEGNKCQEKKSYTGTVAYVPYLDEIEVSEQGEIVGQGKIRINYVSASDIYPLSWSNGYIYECAFVFHKTIGTKKYEHIQIHRIENGQYVIENHVVENTTSTGRDVPVEEWKNLNGFQNLIPRSDTGSMERQFVIDKLNIENNYSEDNPMGIPIFANAIDILQGIDTIYDSYINEFVLGKKRIFVAPELMYTDSLGNEAFDPNDVVFYQLPEDTLKDGGKPITEINMEIRSEEHEKAINNGLNILSLKCGFGSEHYKFDNGNIQTATQVISENSDMYRTKNKHEIILNDVLIELYRIIARLGKVMGFGTNPDSEIVINFDDSIIEDKQAERNEDRKDVAMGVMRLDEYRAKYYGETEEEAAKNLPEQNTVME